MKVAVNIDLEPFKTPNFVRAKADPERIKSGLTEECYPLSALDSDALERLCSDFTAEIFKKAGKQRLPTAG
jgi:hypothetical protein